MRVWNAVKLCVKAVVVQQVRSREVSSVTIKKNIEITVLCCITSRSMIEQLTYCQQHTHTLLASSECPASSSRVNGWACKHSVVCVLYAHMQ